MSQSAIDGCVSEQRNCAALLASGSGTDSERRGIALGLHDWTIEEMLLREEVTARDLHTKQAYAQTR